MPGFQSPNYTQTPNEWFDVHLKSMGYAETKVTAAIIRQTLGFRKTRCQMSLKALVRKTGLAERHVIAGAKAAEDRGLIKRANKGQGRRQVTVWELVIDYAATSPREVADNATTSLGEVAQPPLGRQTTSVGEARLNKTERNQKDTSTAAAAINSNGQPPAAAAAAHGEWWSLDVLMAAGQLPPKHRRQLHAARPSPGAFVSKYLYALTRPTLHKPALWAASQVTANPGAWEGEPFESLAALGPAALAAVLAWLRDDGAYPLNLNGASGLALKLRADLQDKYRKEPGRALTAAAAALADLGLARLVEPAAAGELVADAGLAPEPAPRDPWAETLRGWLTNGAINAAAFDRLSRCKLIGESEGALNVSVPTRIEYEYLTRRLRFLGDVAKVKFTLEEP